MGVLNLNVLIVLVISSLSGTVLAAVCDFGWEPYNDEKCVKIFDTAGLLNYADAEAYCQKQNESNLVSIGFEEKQTFVEDFLRSKDVVDYVWIGLKYNNNSAYEWSDETEFHYSNWAPGSPKNDPDYCVQIQTDDPEFGNWSDVQCTKKNAVLCERLQLWSMAQLQTTVINLMKNPFPIGFIYVQLPNERSPQEIWSWMRWEDVSAAYAGVFFRVEGGGSSPFGAVQEGNSPRLIMANHVQAGPDGPAWASTVNVTATGAWSDPVLSGGGIDDVPFPGLQFLVSADEVRPVNMAVRIWKRME